MIQPDVEHTPPDLLIVGGGLASLLTAWRCVASGRAEHVHIIEASDHLGGNHTWSFNWEDLSEEAKEWIKPALAHHWDGYDVHFPQHSRHLNLGYCTTTTASLMKVIAPLIEQGTITPLTGIKVSSITENEVTLENGDQISAAAIIDARGHVETPHRLLGYQKFVGIVAETELPHRLKEPIIMDATVEQSDGYRFVYCLPYSDTRILIEDTYYEDGPDLDISAVTKRIEAYAAAKGWVIKEAIHREQGILPVTLASNIENQLATETAAVGKIGLAGGLYHAVTGYSSPDAIRMAEAISQLDELNTRAIYECVTAYRRAHWQRERYFRFLNRMLFKAGEPARRYEVLQRFYRLSESIISSFYRGDLKLSQKLRILSGKPPVPVGAALYNLSERSFFKRHGR